MIKTQEKGRQSALTVPAVLACFYFRSEPLWPSAIFQFIWSVTNPDRQR